MTTEEFIEKARKVHGDKYDYSKTEYIRSSEKVCIICPKHGEFWQWPGNHLKGYGCSKCRSDKLRNSNKVTTEEFIKRAREVHGDKYDYSKTEYVHNKEKVCIICHEIDPDTGLEHGEFWQLVSNHLKGKGCKKCASLANRERFADTKDDFIRKAREVHGEKYDYSKVEYVNARKKVIIICHEIDPLTGKEHGEFLQTPVDHIHGCGCPNCAPNKKLTKEDFIRKARAVHGDRYDYSDVNYVNNTTYVNIRCPHCGVFKQLPMVHLRGGGCPNCNNTSYLEAVIRKELNINNPDIKFEEKKKFPWLRRKKPMHLDFYLPEYNVAIECQGQEHFVDFGEWSSLEDNIERDQLKKNLCNEHGVKLYYYSELGWKYPYYVYEDKKKLFEDIRNNVKQS